MSFVKHATGTLALTSALLAAGCGSSDPPIGQGAWLASVGFVPGTCSLSGHNGSVGEVSASTKTEVVTDGVDGASVTCSVTGSSEFSVEGDVSRGANRLRVEVSGLSSAATIDAPVKGSVSIQTPNTVNEYSSSSCNFYFESEKQEVAAGRAWVSFECPAIQHLSTRSTCKITHGVILLENCLE